MGLGLTPECGRRNCGRDGAYVTTIPVVSVRTHDTLQSLPRLLEGTRGKVDLVSLMDLVGLESGLESTCQVCDRSSASS